MGSVKNNTFESFNSKQNKTSDIFSLHSIGKVFTGILALRLVAKGLISEKDLAENKIQLDQNVIDSLDHAPKVKERLKEVTLHQALTHHAGLGVGEGILSGDYLRNYGDKIKLSIASNSVPEIDKIEDFLPFVANQVALFGSEQYIYSNTGMLFGGLSIEYLYNKYREEHPEKKLEALDFNGLLKKYVQIPSEMLFLQPNPPDNFKYNKKITTAKYMAGSPAGGSFTTAENLAKFGKWLYNECQRQSSSSKLELIDLIEKYGQEFYPNPENKTIEHPGDSPSGSSYFLLNLETGNMIIVFNDQRSSAAAEVGHVIQENIFSQEVAETQKVSYAEITDQLSVASKESQSELASIRQSDEKQETKKIKAKHPTSIPHEKENDSADDEKETPKMRPK